MMYKQYLSFALAALVTTNAIAMDGPNDNSVRNIFLLATVTTVAAIALSPQFRSWLFSCITNRLNFFSNTNTTSNSSSSTTFFGKVAIINDKLIINGNGLSQESIDKLPLIQRSGTIENIPLEKVNSQGA